MSTKGRPASHDQWPPTPQEYKRRLNALRKHLATSALKYSRFLQRTSGTQKGEADAIAKRLLEEDFESWKDYFDESILRSMYEYDSDRQLA